MQFAPETKAGEERSFWTVETNFLPGRTFQNLEDLNEQAIQWSTVRMEQRPQGPAGLIPAKAFEHERHFLLKLLEHLPAPYQIHDRGTDQYGYAAFAGNYYWVPGTGRDDIKVLEYSNHIKIYRGRECLAEYELPPNSVNNKLFAPKGLPIPTYRPNNCKKPSQEEEAHLRAMGLSLQTYLDFALNQGLHRHQFIRRLWALSRRMSSELFIKTVERASKYQIINLGVVERMAHLLIREQITPIPSAPIDENFQERPTYKEGFLTEKPDLSIYQIPTDYE